MKLKIVPLAALSVFLTAAAPPSLPQERIDALMAPLGGPYAPGCAVGVMEGGKLTYARGFGAADIATGRPITAATPFNLASLSKQFTGAAVALLIADGKLSEENDVRRYLPELKDYGHAIRLKHLIHHTSGLRNHMALAVFQPTGPLPTHEEALALVFRQSALNFRPGTRHQYESPNYVLLAEIVARVSRQPFGEFLESRIFAPLGMRNTGFSSPRLSRAYTANADGGFRLNDQVNRARGSSGLLSTVEDLSRWLANFESGQVGGKALSERMFAGTILDDGTHIPYSYGLSVDRDHAGIPGLNMIGHGGQTAAYRSTFAYFPGHGFGTVMLCNVSNAPLGAGQEIVGQWAKAKFATVPAEAAGPVAQPLTAAQAATYAGVYHDPAGDELRTLVAEGEALNILFFGQAYPLTHMGNGRFSLDDYAEFRLDGGSLTAVSQGQAPIAFTRLPASAPRPAIDYIGRYRSADVDGEVVATVEGGNLMMAIGDQKVPLQPLYADGFSAPDQGFGHVAFTRDTSGEVDGLSLSTLSGVSRMRFERQ